MKKICFHWTAGPYSQTALDYQHYHYTVGKNGDIAPGKFKPEANIPPLRNGHYAAHCGGGNSHCIGIALCSMAGYAGPASVGAYPITARQAEAAWAFAAKLCAEYGIAVSDETVFTHYEFGRKNPRSDSAGKIDITHLPYEPHVKPDAIGDYIRRKVQWYLLRPQEGRTDA
jgi:hypothetical protein